MVSLLLPIIYLAFISLGLPDALLGAAWPSMYPQLGAGVSWAGGVSMIISVGTIVSSLASDWLNNKLGTGRSQRSALPPPPWRCLGFRPARSSGSSACGLYRMAWVPAVWTPR